MITEITIVRRDGSDDAEITITQPDGQSRRLTVSEQSDEYNRFGDGLDALWDLAER
jgi:hypothetical protein